MYAGNFFCANEGRLKSGADIRQAVQNHLPRFKGKRPLNVLAIFDGDGTIASLALAVLGIVAYGYKPTAKFNQRLKPVRPILIKPCKGLSSFTSVQFQHPRRLELVSHWAPPLRELADIPASCIFIELDKVVMRAAPRWIVQCPKGLRLQHRQLGDKQSHWEAVVLG